MLIMEAESLQPQEVIVLERYFSQRRYFLRWSLPGEPLELLQVSESFQVRWKLQTGFLDWFKCVLIRCHVDIPRTLICASFRLELFGMLKILKPQSLEIPF